MKIIVPICVVLITIAVTIISIMESFYMNIIIWYPVALGATYFLAPYLAAMAKSTKSGQQEQRYAKQLEEEANLAVTHEIEELKGNALKKELVKRRMVREYIANHYNYTNDESNEAREARIDWDSTICLSAEIFFLPLPYAILRVVGLFVGECLPI